jgi:uncharacterized integral membrane protein
MPTTSSYPQTICDGGFRIEISQDELTVTRDQAAWKPRRSSVLARVFYTVFVVIAVIVVVIDFGAALIDRPLIVAALAALLFLPGLLWTRFAGINNLHCTRQNLEVIRIVRRRETGRWLFPRDLVKKVRYAEVAASRYGATFALAFSVEGKKVKVLRGIECPEAQTILRELSRLGFDVVHDIGMPMMVEMALERRGKPQA